MLLTVLYGEQKNQFKRSFLALENKTSYFAGRLDKETFNLNLGLYILMKQFSKSFFTFAMGFFAIAAQTLLFREFITSFESNDIAVGVFFSSWFLWIAVAAMIFGKFEKLAAKFANNIRLILLLYIPAFAVQMLLILQARELAGIPSYALFPIKHMIMIAMIVNFPVSMMTGIVFPATCRWLTEETEIPVSKVYLLEAIGSVSGGLAVTVLLFLEINSIMIFFLISFLVAIAVVLVYQNPIKRRKAMFPILILLVLMCGRFDRTYHHKIQQFKWAKLLPAETYRGSFATARSEYLYGEYNKQFWIVKNGSVCTAVPEQESAARIIATNLSQNPKATEILVIGSGFNICHELLKSSQIKRIYWFYPDYQFIEKVNSLLPAEKQIISPRLTIVKKDIRNFLEDKYSNLDLVIINLRNPESASLNRYFTEGFFTIIKNKLSSSGVLGVKVSSGENVIGTELAYIGATLKATLQKVFPKVVIKAGESTWFIASDNQKITVDPEILAGNFANFADAEKIFPPGGMYSLYEPGRSIDATRIYNSVELPEGYLINRDATPYVYLYELLLSLKQSGWEISETVKKILYAGLFPYLAMAVAFILIWFGYTRGKLSAGVVGENFLLTASSGFLAIGTVIVLMFLYQTRFGSLFLHVGLISSLFMLGLICGTSLTRYLTVKNKISVDRLMFCIIPIQILLFSAIAFAYPFNWNHSLFAFAFFIPGFCNGVFFPIAASRLEKLKIPSGSSGSLLENADHIGATIGALTTGIYFIPLLGFSHSMLLFGVILVMNIPITIIRLSKGDNMNMQALSRKRQTLFFILGAFILIIVFIFSVKLAGKSQDNKKENKNQTKQIEPLEQSKEKHIEELLGPPPKKKQEKSAVKKEIDDEFPPPGSDVKKVDLQKIKKLIKENKLSDHEAEFYKKRD